MFKLNALWSKSEEGYFNPFGGTITPGTQRFQAAVTANISANDEFNIGYVDEKNKTVNVDNGRKTVDAQWHHEFSSKLGMNLGYSLRELTTNTATGTTTTDSQMAKVGLQYNPTEKLSLQVEREQNLVKGEGSNLSRSVAHWRKIQAEFLLESVLHPTSGFGCDLTDCRFIQHGLCEQQRTQRNGVWDRDEVLP